MSVHSFKFKQFVVEQDSAAMKVGTDGVLLGAWADINSDVFHILDIGTGTGLIALMMAQRSNAEVIDGVELNDEAYEQTVNNFEQSNWGDRLFCYHASFQEFVEEIDTQYDLIVSNPPFYTSTFKELSESRAMARHSDSLLYSELLNGTAKILAKGGTCAFIIPFSEEENFIKIAKENNLYIYRITRVKGTAEAPIKRSLLQFSFVKKTSITTELIIETERHVYTDAYKNLVRDFYLKM